MGCTVEIFYRSADAVFLCVVLLFQSVMLNYFIISHFRDSVLPFFWFLCDFFCLLTFSFSLFVAYRSNWKLKRKSMNVCSNNSVSSGRSHSRNSSSDSEQGSAYGSSADCFSQASRLPFSYVSWIVYSVFLIAKIVVLFKSDIPQTLSDKNNLFFGPQMVKFSLGVTALIFSLVVEAHHHDREDVARHEYIKSVSYGMALEILDSVRNLSVFIADRAIIALSVSQVSLILDFFLQLSHFRLLDQVQ